jgi:pyruvate,orthophosphate dikinase
VRGLLGGKGANLAEMTRIEVPVPPGFTITTEACNAYLAARETFPEGIWDQVRQTIAGLEKESGKKFGDRKNPLKSLKKKLVNSAPGQALKPMPN